METTIQQTLCKITAWLESIKVRYVLVGGLAASIRGRTRATDDVDLIVDCDADDAMNLLNSLDPEEFGPLFPEVEQVIRQSYILPIEDKRSGIKLDLAIGASGFEKLILDRATPVKILGLMIPVATPEDILLMKVIASRTQDLQDIKGILIANGKDLDWTYCLEIADQLQEALGMDLVEQLNQYKSDSQNPNRETD